MRRYIILAIIAILCTFTSITSAETQHVDASYTYTAGAAESIDSAKIHAIEEAKHLAVEKVGTYVSSYSKINNMTLTEDEVKAVAAQIIKVKVKESNVKFISDSEFQVYVDIDASVNSFDVTQEALDEAIKENKKAKTTLQGLSDYNERERIRRGIESDLRKELYQELSYYANTTEYNINGRTYVLPYDSSSNGHRPPNELRRYSFLNELFNRNQGYYEDLCKWYKHSDKFYAEKLYFVEFEVYGYVLGLYCKVTEPELKSDINEIVKEFYNNPFRFYNTSRRSPEEINKSVSRLLYLRDAYYL